MKGFTIRLFPIGGEIRELEGRCNKNTQNTTQKNGNENRGARLRDIEERGGLAYSYLEVQREMKETRVRAIFEEIRAERELLRDTMHFK